MPARAALKILVGFLAREFADRAACARLSLQFRPIKRERRISVFGQFTPFAALVIRIKNEAALIRPFEQNNASGRSAGLAGGGQRHGSRLQHLRVDGLLKPLVELRDGVGTQISPAQTSQSVASP